MGKDQGRINTGGMNPLTNAQIIFEGMSHDNVLAGNVRGNGGLDLRQGHGRSLFQDVRRNTTNVRNIIGNGMLRLHQGIQGDPCRDLLLFLGTISNGLDQGKACQGPTLGRFHHFTIQGKEFGLCLACSDAIVAIVVVVVE